MPKAKVRDLLGVGARGGGGRGKGDGQRPWLAGEELKRLDRLAEQVSLLPGVKCHRREMVHKVLSSTLSRVVDGGDLDEEDDGYYSSSDEEGEVTDAMAARGVGEAGRVVVSPSIWNKGLSVECETKRLMSWCRV